MVDWGPSFDVVSSGRLEEPVNPATLTTADAEPTGDRHVITPFLPSHALPSQAISPHRLLLI